jgi:hypothetical protein
VTTSIVGHNPCNSGGMAQRFAEVMRELNRCPESTGTAWVNQHPITRLWLDKLTSLARTEQSLECRSYEQVEKLARGEDVEFKVV